MFVHVFSPPFSSLIFYQSKATSGRSFDNQNERHRTPDLRIENSHRSIVVRSGSRHVSPKWQQYQNKTCSPRPTALRRYAGAHEHLMGVQRNEKPAHLDANEVYRCQACACRGVLVSKLETWREHGISHQAKVANVRAISTWRVANVASVIKAA
ncbi:hypothetical protein LX36DRAFT_655891 [Colletotrichum falcatum]|nr:hypothetical protein LX36DRAFT_655891 [Colletotrichum falcatum]